MFGRNSVMAANLDSSFPLEEDEEDEEDDDELDEFVANTDMGNEVYGEEKGGNDDDKSRGDKNLNLHGKPTKHDKEQEGGTVYENGGVERSESDGFTK